MRAGDRLVSVNGTRVLGGSHAKALALLERAAEAHGEVTLGLWRPPPSLPASASTSTVSNCHLSPLHLLAFLT